jgi:hypothetical protein
MCVYVKETAILIRTRLVDNTVEISTIVAYGFGITMPQMIDRSSFLNLGASGSRLSPSDF